MPIAWETKTMKQWVFYSDMHSIDGFCIFCSPMDSLMVITASDNNI